MEPILPGKEAGKRAGAGVSSDVSDITDWKDRDDYKALAQEYLRPYHKELLQLFKKIG